MNERPNILVVCARNKRRSKTAEIIYKDAVDFNLRSAGLSPKSPSQISRTKIEWADLVLVMEDDHKKRIKQSYRDCSLPPIRVLHIPDEYAYMDPELIRLLRDSLPYIISEELF